MGGNRINIINRLYCNRAVVDLNTWLASAFEENDNEVDGHNTISLDLEPPGFECKAFRDLSVRR